MQLEQSTEWVIEPLSKAHNQKQFDCGEQSLNEYLAQHARQNHDSGMARTFVSVNTDKPNRILGYYSLAVGSIDRANLPTEIMRRLPNFPIPVARLARLAVSKHIQRQGLGEDLLLNALHRCLRVSDEIGLIAIVIDAKHDQAKKFYNRYEFEALPDQPLILWLPMAAVKKMFA